MIDATRFEVTRRPDDEVKEYAIGYLHDLRQRILDRQVAEEAQRQAQLDEVDELLAEAARLGL